MSKRELTEKMLYSLSRKDRDRLSSLVTTIVLRSELGNEWKSLVRIEFNKTIPGRYKRVLDFILKLNNADMDLIGGILVTPILPSPPLGNI